jgi:hypothetical protein
MRPTIGLELVYLVSACNRAEYAGEWRINAASVSWE